MGKCFFCDEETEDLVKLKNMVVFACRDCRKKRKLRKLRNTTTLLSPNLLNNLTRQKNL